MGSTLFICAWSRTICLSIAITVGWDSVNLPLNSSRFCSKRVIWVFISTTPLRTFCVSISRSIDPCKGNWVWPPRYGYHHKGGLWTEQRSGVPRSASRFVLENVLQPLAGEQLKWRQIHGLHFDAVAILDGLDHLEWEQRGKAINVDIRNAVRTYKAVNGLVLGVWNFIPIHIPKRPHGEIAAVCPLWRNVCLDSWSVGANFRGGGMNYNMAVGFWLPNLRMTTKSPCHCLMRWSIGF